MTNLGYPAIPVHPGEIIKEELQFRGIQQKYLAEIIGVSYTYLNDVLNGRKPVSADFALTIEAATNINAEMLVNMQSRYNLQIARSDKTKVRRWEKIHRVALSLLA